MVRTPMSGGMGRWLGLGGLVGPVIFVVAVIVGGLIRPGYSPVARAISDLGVGAHAWIEDVGAIVLGVLLLACVAGFVLVTPPVLSRGQRAWSAALLSLPGLGFITVGIFTEAPATLIVHSLASAVALLGAFAGFLVTGLGLIRFGTWRTWGWYSVVTSAATLVLIVLLYLTLSPASPLAGLRIGGLAERLVILVMLAWYAATGWRIAAVSRGR